MTTGFDDQINLIYKEKSIYDEYPQAGVQLERLLQLTVLQIDSFGISANDILREV